MIRVHLLSPGYASANSQAVLHPLLVHRRALAAAGVALDVFTRPAARFADADVAAVDSKAFSTRWDSAERDATLSLLARWRERTGALLWLDSGDSTALMQPWVLPFVDRYLKAQLLRDRTEYRHAWYGQRPYTDHAHRYAAIVDASPARSQPVTESRELAKLGVYWNSGLADHSLYGPWRAAAFRRLPLPSLLGYTNRFADPRAPRTVAVNARMKADYPRATVAHMRRAVLGTRADAVTGRLPRRAYLAELARSRLVLSPFGWGEINLRDFEAFIAGAAIVKPDMTHLETWPELFHAGRTMLPHRWDLADLDAVLERALADPAETAAIAASGQAEYRAAISGPAGEQAFAHRAIGLFTSASAMRAAAAAPAVRAANAATAPC